MQRLLSICAALVYLLACGPRNLSAEVLVLKSGGRVEGQLLNPERATVDAYHVRLPAGLEVSLAAEQVHRVIAQSDVQKQYDQLLPKMPNTADGHWQIAEWCKEAGLTANRKSHLERVLKLEPDHEGARTALGYSRYGSRWMTQEEYLRSQGYVRATGGWKLRQEVELDSLGRQRELGEKDWRRKLKIWFDQLDSPRRSSDALTNIQSIRDPLAAAALTEALANPKAPRQVRLLCLDVLNKLPAGVAEMTLIQLATGEPDANLRDRCLDELKRAGSRNAIVKFSRDLKSKDNRIVNRGAICLQRMGDPETTRDLIEALVTEHKFIVQQGGSPGSMGASFGGGGGGSGGGGDGGMGGLSMGGKPKMIKADLKNEMVLSALTAINPGINYGFDEDAWRRWYVSTHTTVEVNLRRDL
jgi:HEAT repeat protein